MSSYDDLILAGSPASYWQLDETSGTNANDSNTTNNNDGTYTGSYTLAAEPGAVDADSAVSFPGGTGNYVTVPDNNSLDFLDTMTFECWIKRSSATAAVQGLISKTGTNGPRLVLHSDHRLRMTRGGTNIVASTITITDTTNWHHCVMTKGGSTTLLYIDGVDVTGTVTNLTLSNTANVLLIGAATTTSFPFTGLMQKVAVYPTVLSPAVIASHYAARSLRELSDSATVADSWALTVESTRSDTAMVSDVITPVLAPAPVGWPVTADSLWPVTAGTAWAQTADSEWTAASSGNWPQQTDSNWS